ncbi:hypothetical protein [Ornithinimicrobium kibberense]|uniref:hypothetical protein n=1 Tax=Ornithinimicrobium kibberense TaxID=282060 RepID=UPI00361BE64D
MADVGDECSRVGGQPVRLVDRPDDDVGVQQEGGAAAHRPSQASSSSPGSSSKKVAGSR